MKIIEYVLIIIISVLIIGLTIKYNNPTGDNHKTLKIDTLEVEKIVVKSRKSGTSLSEIVISSNQDSSSISFWTVDDINRSTKLFKIDSRKDGKIYINYNDKERELHEFVNRPRILGESLE